MHVNTKNTGYQHVLHAVRIAAALFGHRASETVEIHCIKVSSVVGGINQTLTRDEDGLHLSLAFTVSTHDTYYILLLEC